MLHIRATLQRAAGRLDEAERCYTLARDRAERAGAAPFTAWIALEHAQLLVERHGDARRADIDELARHALDLAQSLGADGLARRARSLLSEHEPSGPCAGDYLPASAAAEVAIERDGESWLVRAGAVQLRLADSKGLKWLAQLVSEPGREFHVLDLSAAAGVVDRGDAGEVLDPRSRGAGTASRLGGGARPDQRAAPPA
ncbi:MAG TPA: hypothetical protein VMG12_26725 [Polyangiaceae bacterium]|nr:hypothetical protein [Polyangiaceae bacterium]